MKFWISALGLLAAAIYSFVDCFRAWRKNRLVEDTPTSRVRSAAQGYVEFTGRGAMPPDCDNRAPLSGIHCTWWRFTIEERQFGGWWRNWTTLRSDTSEVPFVLDDGSGRCLIDPRGADVYPRARDVWFGDSEWPGICLPNVPGIAGWLANAFAGGNYRYTEQRLESHDRLYAIGSFRSLGGVSVDSPERAVAELLRDWKRDQAQLLARFDTNHDAVLSAAEWDDARAAARAEVERGLATSPASGMSVLSKPTDGRAFLLAASDEESLAKTLRRRAVAGVAVFVGSSAALTWLLSRV